MLPDQELSTPKIDDGNPDFIAFFHENLSSCDQGFFRVLVFEEFEFSDAFVGETFTGFILVAEAIERLVRSARNCGSIIEEIQFQIDLRQIELTQRAVIPVARLPERLVGGMQHRDRAAVFPAQEVHPCDVVIRLQHCL